MHNHLALRKINLKKDDINMFGNDVCQGVDKGRTDPMDCRGSWGWVNHEPFGNLHTVSRPSSHLHCVYALLTVHIPRLGQWPVNVTASRVQLEKANMFDLLRLMVGGVRFLAHLPTQIYTPHTLTDFCANWLCQLPTTSDDWCRLGWTHHNCVSYKKILSKICLKAFCQLKHFTP